MKKFDFRQPTKCYRKGRLTRLNIVRVDIRNFTANWCVPNEMGFVKVFVMDWDTNSGPDRFMMFEIIKDGICYRAFLNQYTESEKQIKSWSTSFVNQLKIKYSL